MSVGYQALVWFTGSSNKTQSSELAKQNSNVIMIEV